MDLDIRHDRLTSVVDVKAKLERVASGFEFIEGPIWHPYEQYLVFSDIVGNTMYIWRSSGGIDVFRKPSNMANGNTFDRMGRILTCEHATSRVTRTLDSGTIEVLASHFDGKELNSPNDIITKNDGKIYFTDPTSGRSPYYGVPRDPELPFRGVYQLDPDTRELTLLIDDFDKPNGLCFSFDEKHLFVNDTNRKHIRVFDVKDGDTVENSEIWAELKGEGVGVADGMKIDRDGNLYCCGPGGIHLFDSNATCLGVMILPEHTANFTWGDEDMQTLYITASTSLYRLRLKIPGLKLFDRHTNFLTN
jgi:gluconolactonase